MMSEETLTPSRGAWGNVDKADNSPIFSPAYANKAITEENADEMYTSGSGQYLVAGVTAEEITSESADLKPAHTGWILTKTGTGGRAGRVQTEVLVAMSGLESGEAGVDTQNLDETE